MAEVWAFNLTLAIVAMAINVSVCLIAIVLLIVVCLAAKKQKSITDAVEIFPMAIQMITYSEIPMSIIAVIADYLEIPLQEVIDSYAEDAKHRRSIVLKAFQKDPVTDRFIKSYKSKFIKNGYVGEEMLNPS
uniref:Uncharacterized protein n=1 Tax=Ditylenchus dipsaci TaxID=166011 RepID=A0A915EH18_9BILA